MTPVRNDTFKLNLLSFFLAHFQLAVELDQKNKTLWENPIKNKQVTLLELNVVFQQKMDYALSFSLSNLLHTFANLNFRSLILTMTA